MKKILARPRQSYKLEHRKGIEYLEYLSMDIFMGRMGIILELVLCQNQHLLHHHQIRALKEQQLS